MSSVSNQFSDSQRYSGQDNASSVYQTSNLSNENIQRENGMTLPTQRSPLGYPQIRDQAPEGNLQGRTIQYEMFGSGRGVMNEKRIEELLRKEKTLKVVFVAFKSLALIGVGWMIGYYCGYEDAKESWTKLADRVYPGNLPIQKPSVRRNAINDSITPIPKGLGVAVMPMHFAIKLTKSKETSLVKWFWKQRCFFGRRRSDLILSLLQKISIIRLKKQALFYQKQPPVARGNREGAS